MNPIIKPWLELWDYLDGNFWHTCQIAEQLTSAEISWQPIPQVASLGWNLQHLAEMLDYYLAEVFRRGQRLHAAADIAQVVLRSGRIAEKQPLHQIVDLPIGRRAGRQLEHRLAEPLAQGEVYFVNACDPASPCFR